MNENIVAMETIVKISERERSLSDGRARSPLSASLASCLISGNQVGSTSRYKTELCRPFEELGKCRYGDKCQFAHGAGDLRSVERHPKHKTELCRSYHTTGLCPYGSRCHFIHNEFKSSPRQPMSTDLISGLAGILAASMTSYRTTQPPVMMTLGPAVAHPQGFGGGSGAGVASGGCNNLIAATSQEGMFLPQSPAPLPGLCVALPTPSCSVLPLEMELGSIVQRRRQMRGSLDSPTEWSISSGSASSSSSSPITSYLDEAFSPTPTSNVFSPLIGQHLGPPGLHSANTSLIGQYLGPSDIHSSNSVLIDQYLGPSDLHSTNRVEMDSSAMFILSNANRMYEDLKSTIPLQQVMPNAFDLNKVNDKIEGFFLSQALNANNPSFSNLESGLLEGTGYTPSNLLPQTTSAPFMSPTSSLLPERLNALNMKEQ